MPHGSGRAVLLVGLVLAVGAVAQERPELVVRHEHYFVVVNDTQAAPTITVQSKGFFTYPHGLQLQVVDDRALMRFETRLPVGGQMERAIPGPVAPYYLVVAEPEMNGVIFGVDRPWGVVAGGGHGLGSNGPVPPLYLYVPPECTRFTVTCDATSPREGGRVTVLAPDGSEALVMDGEFDKPETREVAVPAEQRAKVWALNWAKPQTVQAGLDDIVVSVDGELAPLLWPKKEWAEQHGPEMWERHRKALQKE